jgi:hypothetical protein
MTELARAISSCKRQAPPIDREGAPHQQIRHLSDSNKNPVLGPRWGLETMKEWPNDRRS